MSSSKGTNFIQLMLMLFLLLITTTFDCKAKVLKLDPNKKYGLILGVFTAKGDRTHLLEMARDKVEELESLYGKNENTREKALIYCFTDESVISKEEGFIKNVKMRFKSRKSGEYKWYRVEKVPLPDIIYEFSFFYEERHGREKVRRGEARRKEVLALNLPMINSRKVYDYTNDKKVFAEVMLKNGILHPKTYPSNYENNLKAVLEFDVVYFKPYPSSQGNGIIIVSKNDNDELNFIYRVKGEDKVWRKVEEEGIPLEELEVYLTKARRETGIDSSAEYIAQQGIKTHQYGKGDTSFRVHTQRGAFNKLCCSGLCGAHGGHDSQDGVTAYYREISRSLARSAKSMYSSPQKIEMDLIDLGFKVHLALEEGLGEQIGELGMDVVPDESGRLFVIEANPKPGGGGVFKFKDADDPQMEEKIKEANKEKKVLRGLERDEHLLGYAYYLREEQRKLQERGEISGRE